MTCSTDTKWWFTLQPSWPTVTTKWSLAPCIPDIMIITDRMNKKNIQHRLCLYCTDVQFHSYKPSVIVLISFLRHQSSNLVKRRASSPRAALARFHPSLPQSLFWWVFKGSLRIQVHKLLTVHKSVKSGQFSHGTNATRNQLGVGKTTDWHSILSKPSQFFFS